MAIENRQVRLTLDVASFSREGEFRTAVVFMTGDGFSLAVILY